MCYSSSFSTRNSEVHFSFFFPSLIAHGTKTSWAIAPIFGVVGGRCIQISRKLSIRWRIMPLGGAKDANFFKMGNFKRPSLTNRRTQSYQLYRFAKPVRALVHYHVLSRSLYNWGRYCALNFEKSPKIVKVWGPLTRVREEIQKSGRCKIFNFIA